MLLALACYFHILVGGWVALAVFSVQSLYADIKKVTYPWRFLIVFHFLLLPLILFISSTGVLQQTDLFPVNPDWIYVYFQNKHHVGIFFSVNYFISYHLKGLVMVLLATSAGWFLVKVASSTKTKMLSRLCTVCFSIMLLGTVVSLVDINGTLLKFHPFRIGAIANFFFFLLLIIEGKTWFVKPRN